MDFGMAMLSGLGSGHFHNLAWTACREFDEKDKFKLNAHLL
jgi:hypothetical protein